MLLGRPLSAPSGLSVLEFYGERTEEEKAERRPHLSPAQTDSAHFLKPSSSLFFRGAIIPYSLSLKSQAGKEQQSTKNWRERREATTPFFRQEEKGGGATQFGAVLSLSTTLWAASGQAILLPGEEKIGKLVFMHHIFIWRNADNYGVERKEIVYANIHRVWCSSIRRLLLYGLETVARGSANNYYFHGRKGREGVTKHSHLQNGSEADFIFITLNQILKQHRDMVSHKNQGFFFHAHMTRHSKLDEILSKHLCSKCFFSSLFTPAASIRRIHT